MIDIFKNILSTEHRAALRDQQQPRFTKPMLATLTDDRFDDPEWIYERKLDGERCLVFRDGDDARIMSRNEKPLNDSYPVLADEFASQPRTDFIMDGEIVAFDGNVTSFSRLQQRMQINDPEEARRSPVAVYCYVFDLLHLEGKDTTRLPLRDRKRLLRATLSPSRHIRLTVHRNGSGLDYLEQACSKGWEGLIAKRADSRYTHSRSTDWLKFKCVNQQEFVIGGYTEPEGERTGFGAIVIGFYDGDELVCAGKVGTGFDDTTLRSLGDRMKSRERKTSPFDNGDEPSGDVHWITPQLVGEIAFTEWTDDARLRHPRFLGLRRDKNAKDVVREKPDPSA